MYESQQDCCGTAGSLGEGEAAQVCQAISEDLKRTDIDFQAGSLVQLCEVTKKLAEQLDGVLNRRK